MDREELKKEIEDIAKIAESVPDAFKEKCFEILLKRMLSKEDSKKSAEEKKEDF